MTTVQVNDYLTWEYSSDPEIQYLNCPAPEPVKNFLPEWVRNLKGNLKEYLPEGFGMQHTIRHCLGFRGLLNIGYTIPLPETIDGYDTYFSRGHLHPEMMHGTQWANRSKGAWTHVPDFKGNRDSSPYEYQFRLMFWPWRARMALGWRLIILPYLLNWNQDWHEFAGSVEPNYEVHNGTSIGSGLKWHQLIDNKYNYYNLETVMAFRRGTMVDKGTVTFCAVPYYDPEFSNYQKEKV
jgi:hypothetical protein